MHRNKPTYDASWMLDTASSMMQEGCSKVEVIAALGVSKEAFYEWCNPKKSNYHPEFAEVVQLGELHCQAWWEKQGRINLHERNFNSGLWYMNMKNRFGWADQQKKEIGFGMSVAWPLPKSKLDG